VIYSTKVCEYRNLTENIIPSKLMGEWKALFLAGNPLTATYEFPLRRDAVLSPEEIENTSDPTGIALRYPRTALGEDVASTEAENVLRGVQLLDEVEFNDYLKGSGDWIFPPEVEELPSMNPTLGRIVDTLLEITTQPENEKDKPRLPAHPVRLALIGKRFAGKTSVAQELAQRYGLAVISTDALLREALSKAEEKGSSVSVEPSTGAAPAEDAPVQPASPPTVTVPLSNSVPASVAASQTVGSAGPHPGSADPSAAVASDPLAETAMATLLAGKDLDDASMVALFADAAKKYDALALKGKIGGWVLDGFPRTRAQAQLLERALSGYEDPKPIRPGNMKRGSRVGTSSSGNGQSLTAPSASSRKKSLVAPTMREDEQEEMLRAESGIDAVIMLETENIRAISRAAGRRLDPFTGNVYHIEFRPPPLDEIVSFSSLVFFFIL
jgi:adenylate kinase family enzyme